MKKMMSRNTTSIMGVMFIPNPSGRFRFESFNGPLLGFAHLGRPSGWRTCSTRLPASATRESIRVRNRLRATRVGIATIRPSRVVTSASGDRVGEVLGLGHPAGGGNGVERLDHPLDGAEQPEHRRDRADDAQDFGLAVEPSGLLLALFLGGGAIFGEPEFRAVVAAEAGERDVGEERLGPLLLAIGDRLVNLAVADQSIEMSNGLGGDQPLLTDRDRVVNDRRQRSD